MLVPIQHENMSTRRWPIITLALIAINVLVFLSTHWVMEIQHVQLSEVRQHILILAALHPQLNLTPEVQEWVDDFKNHDLDDWTGMQNPNSEIIDDWDARTRRLDDPAALQAEMDLLGDQYSQRIATSVDQRYGFIPGHPKAIAYLTSNFLHTGWLHLIGNIWFLWLAGFVLEDVWGRPLYTLFYLTAAGVAAQFDAWASPGSIIPCVGASGAVAGLMGAFLVRFPTTKIRMMWFFDLGLFPFWRFWARAYWLLPLWLMLEISYGTGSYDGIAHWAHIGGFAFGSLAALAFRYSGLEHKMNKAIEQKIAWSSPEQVTEACNLIEQQQFDEATAILNEYLSGTPDSYHAWNLLRAIHWQRSDVSAYRDVTIKLCALHLRAKEREAAWRDYEEFLQLGGDNMPADIWLDLCRIPEEQQDYERALREYQKIVCTYPSTRESLSAQLAAAKLCLQRLKRPKDALRFYEAASASSVPHLDLEAEIEWGIRESRNAQAGGEPFPAKAASAGS